MNLILNRFASLPWILIFVITGLAIAGVAVLYSATATNPGEAGLPARHAIRFGLAFLIMIIIGMIPIGVWARIAFPAYLGVVVLLIGVEFYGSLGGGAQRWLELGPITLQPSELMKIALVLALARYYHMVQNERDRSFFDHIPSLAMIAVPAYLVFRQPDLGTALMLTAAGGAMIFFAGIQKRYVIGTLLIAAIASPLAFYFVLKPYQQERVLTAFDPSRDPLGAGYQIQQAKIAIGSGGVNGRGFMQGTQSQLDYIPEQHTDFIFTVVAEEAGFVGAFGLLMAFGTIFVLGLMIAARSKHAFGRLAAAGIVVTIAFYVVVNVGMVMGLLPVVGVPLPLISYGGTVMITVMAAFGLLCSIHVDRDREHPLVLSGAI